MVLLYASISVVDDHGTKSGGCAILVHETVIVVNALHIFHEN